MIKLNNISILTDDKVIIKDVSFTIDEKTMNVILGLEDLQLQALFSLLEGRWNSFRGEYFYCGKRFIELSNLQKASIRKREIRNTINESFYNAEISILKNLQNQLKTSGIYPSKWKGIIDFTLQRLDILHLKEKKGDELSTGQLIMAKLAKALMINPKLILMRNPLENLSEIEAIKIWNMLVSISGEVGILMEATSHEIFQDMSIDCNKIIFNQ